MAFSEKTIPVQCSPICLVFSNAVCPSFRAIAVAGPGKKDAEICPSSNIISLKGILFISGLFTSPGCRQARFITSSVAYSTKVLPETEIFFPFKFGESAALLFTAGSAHLLPKTFDAFLEKIFHSGGTLTIQLYLSASKGEFEVAFGIAVVLLVIVLLINFGDHTKRRDI